MSFVTGYLEPDHEVSCKSFSEMPLPAQGIAQGPYTIPSLPAMNQGSIGSCVLNAWCGSLEDLLFLERAYAEHLSRLFLYWLCRLHMKSVTQDTGTYCWLAGDRLSKIGVCPERVWQYSGSNLYKDPNTNLETFTMASDNKNLEYYRIDSWGEDRLRDIETAVRSNHSPIIATRVDSAIQDYKIGQVLGAPKGTIIGGHAMRVRGIRYTPAGDRIWVWRNSWGTNYGDQGDLLVNDEWMASSMVSEIFVATRMQPLMI